MPINVLLIISDEHRKDALSSLGHPTVKTPHIDALASTGTVFTNAYTPSPMCVPARAALACGDYVHKTRFWDSATPYDGSKESWMHKLRAADIPVHSFGKLHYKSPDNDNGFTHEHLPMHVVNELGWTVGLLRKNPPPYDVAAELAEDVGVGSTGYTDYDLAITEAATNFLTSEQAQEKPWVSVVSFVSPHYPLTAPKEYYQLYDPETVDMPLGYNDSNLPTHPELKRVRRFFDYQAYFTEQRLREARVAYYGLTTFMDNCVGQLVNALQTSGLTDDTLIIYTSDHGEMLGDHGYWTKQVMYEGSAGVPLVMSGPGVTKNLTSHTPCSLLDIPKTICTAAGMASEDCKFGDDHNDSLTDIAVDEKYKQRSVLSEYHDGGSSTGTFMLRWDKWKYVYYVGEDPQLFNLDADPHETTNLALDGDAATSMSETNLGTDLGTNATLTIKDVLAEGDRRLRAICDPELVDQQCFADQHTRIEELGGEDVLRNTPVFNHTPAPGSS